MFSLGMSFSGDLYVIKMRAEIMDCIMWIDGKLLLFVGTLLFAPVGLLYLLLCITLIVTYKE